MPTRTAAQRARLTREDLRIEAAVKRAVRKALRKPTATARKSRKAA